MADQRLTDKTLDNSKPDDLDLMWKVDVSDITDHPTGSGKRSELPHVLKGRSFLPILGCLVHKAGSNPTINTIDAGDVVIYIRDSTSENRLVIGIAKQPVTAVPSDFDNKALFDKFIDTSSLLG